MCRRTPQIGMLALLISIVASAWSQTGRYTVPAASVGDEFPAYHRALDSAADLTLANVGEGSESGRQCSDEHYSSRGCGGAAPVC